MSIGQFTTTQVDVPADIPGFSKWLVGRAHAGEALGLAVRDRSRKLAFSGMDDCYVVDMKNNPIAAGVLRAVLLEQKQLQLMLRNVAADLPELCRLLASTWDMKPIDVFRELHTQVASDMTAAAHVINQNVTKPGKFRQLEQNAYEIALVAPQYESGIAPYYSRVGLPLAKLTAEQALAGKVEATWWVTYNNLWLRVMAYYSGDPTLRWMFFNDQRPFETLGKLFKCEDREAELMMLWIACGRDMDTVAQRFPSLPREMADGPQDWGRTIDRALPMLSSATMDMKRAYFDMASTGGMKHSTITTLYGRRLRPGASPGEGVAFRVFGTVEDLVSVAAVTFWTNRVTNDILIRRAEGGPAEETVRVIGSGPREDRNSWMNQLRELATLATPLGAELSLNPIVTQAVQ